MKIVKYRASGYSRLRAGFRKTRLPDLHFHKPGFFRQCNPGPEFLKKTRMKSKTSHPSNENFALRIQFPVELNIVDKTQNFHDKVKKDPVA